MAYHFMCHVMILRALFDEWGEKKSKNKQEHLVSHYSFRNVTLRVELT